MAPGAPVPFPRRPLDAHKGTCGHAIVVAGSRGKTGAAFLAGKACLRTGAGLVTIACPASANAALEVKTTCVMTEPFSETEAGTLARAALDPLRSLLEGKAAVALGPGLSRHPETVALIHDLLAQAEGPPVVIDADGLNAFEGEPERLSVLAGRAVLTPHPGEFRRLAGDYAPARREELLRAFVSRVGVVTLLKGHRTLVAGRDPAAQGEVRVYQNTTGNPGMASGGTGDVLTGVIAGLLAQGLSPFDAACLGAYLHGKAGDAAARRTGWAPLIATDLLEGLIEAIRSEEERA